MYHLIYVNNTIYLSRDIFEVVGLSTSSTQQNTLCVQLVENLKLQEIEICKSDSPVTVLQEKLENERKLTEYSCLKLLHHLKHHGYWTDKIAHEIDTKVCE